MATLHAPNAARLGPHTEAEFAMMWSHLIADLANTEIDHDGVDKLRTRLDDIFLPLQASLPKDEARRIYDRHLALTALEVGGKPCSVRQLIDDTDNVLSWRV